MRDPPAYPRSARRRAATFAGRYGRNGYAQQLPSISPYATPQAAGALGAAAGADDDFTSPLRSPAWPWKVRVGENSPSLCPTIFSVQYTGMNLWPLCTAKVSPIMSGTTIERRDQVRIILLSPAAIALSTFFCRWVSTKGPFFSDLGIAIP